MDDLKILPEWKQAVKEFLAAKFTVGDVISHAWLEERFGMVSLKDDESLTVAEFQKRQFVWLANIEAFKNELLEGHQIFLSSVHGEGYRIIPPGEQTEAAQEKFEREAKKAYRRAAMTLKNVRVSELTDAEKQTNTDAIARLAMLRGMHKGLNVD